MRISCSRSVLQEALGVIAAAVPTQATTPVALDVLIQASEDGLRLQSTDLTIFAEVRVLELKEVTPGEALIPVTRLVGLVRELASEDVVVERDPSEFSVRLSAGSDEFRIMGHDPGDFPEAPVSTEARPVAMENETLGDALRSVAFAASRDVARQQLQGVAVILEGKKVHFVASDGKRLAEYTAVTAEETDRRREGIVPIRAVDAIERLLSLDSGLVSLRLDPEAQQVVVSHDRGQVLCRLLQGQMPDYVSMIPTDFAGVAEGAARDLLVAVRKAAVLTTKENAVVSVVSREGGLSVQVSSQDVGSGVVPVENMTSSGEELSVSFAVSFLSDGLRVLGERPVRLGLQKDRGAAVMHGGRSFRYAFMPVVPHGADA
jgi:DNA polymerase-3 subunit beta